LVQKKFMSDPRLRDHRPKLLFPPKPLEKRGAEPLYLQIEKLLTEAITSGLLAEGQPLDSEQDMAKLYRVSRMTARQALQGLKNKGYAVSIRRKGTFVSRPKIEKTLMRLQGFSQEMLSRGMKPSSKVIEGKTVAPSDYIAERLQLAPGEKVFKLRRLRLADNNPIAIEESFTPIKDFPGVESLDFSRHSLYATLISRYGATLGWSDDVIEASNATAEEARLLTIPRGFGILSISRLVMTPAGHPIETVLSRYRSDRYRAMIRIPG
jgi:GntR family transcriptional regulator